VSAQTAVELAAGNVPLTVNAAFTEAPRKQVMIIMNDLKICWFISNLP
jgi:hypothetical protein